MVVAPHNNPTGTEDGAAEAMTKLRNHIKRRRFLKGMGAASAAYFTGIDKLSSESPKETASYSQTLKGFILSDAHFGWKSPQQPSNQVIANAVQHILGRFPDLDFLVDTGDAHHNYATDTARTDWTAAIANACKTLPFFVAAGNHDISYFEGEGLSQDDCDKERRCGNLYSYSCRPYYSFDFKGIHLVALPQLICSNYVTGESLDWLKLDLALNANKTVIILSHNSLKDTTSHGDDVAYRQTVNSEPVLDLLKQHPNVVAWMHGHNHTYEIIPKFNKLFVSNGRIGGFPPKDHAGSHLGGIYFEVKPTQLIVRCYSVSSEAFLDELGFPELTQHLDFMTSLDSQAPFAISYGQGRALDGQRQFVTNHFALGKGKSELFVSGTEGTVINENASMTFFKERPPNPALKGNAGRLFPAVSVDAPHENWQWLEHGGIQLNAEPPQDKRITISVPDTKAACYSYYHCAPGKKYLIQIELEPLTLGEQVTLSYHVHDMAGNELDVLAGPEWALPQGRSTQEIVFELPAVEAGNIYDNPALDQPLNVSIAAQFANLRGTVKVYRFALLFPGPDQKTRDAVITIDQKRYAQAGELAPGATYRFELPASTRIKNFVEVKAGGNQRLNWLVRQTAPAWQVRNAPVVETPQGLEVGPLRNPYSARNEIVIVPLVRRQDPYIHRLRHLDVVRIQPWANGELVVEVIKVIQAGEIEIHSMQAPNKMLAGWKYEFPRLIIPVNSPGIISISI